MSTYDKDDDALLWSLREVADAAREIPVEAQTPRLTDALARLVAVAPPTPQVEEATP